MGKEQSADSLQLYFKDESGSRKVAKVEAGPFSLGRSPSCDLSLPFSGVSRLHARLVRTAEKEWALEDLGSTNGTFLNGAKVQGSQGVRGGDVLILGNTSIRIQTSSEAVPSPFSDTDTRTITRSIFDLSRSWAPAESEAGSTAVKRPAVRRLQDLVEIAKELNLAVSIEAIFDRAKRVVFRYLKDVERLALLVDVEGDGELKLLNSAARTEDLRAVIDEDAGWISKSISRKAFAEKLAIQTSDAQADSRFEDALSIVGKGIRSAMVVPLWNEDQVVGVLYADAQISSERWAESGDEDLVFFSSLANLVATAVQRWLMAEKLRSEGILRERLERVAQFLEKQHSEEVGQLVGKSPVVKKLRRFIKEQARLNEPLLLQGETGSGKELIARLIHAESERSATVLFSVDCRQISENEWGDQLFGTHYREGHEQAPSGPFCYLELCQGGAILLKNVETLPESVQARLARFLRGSRSLNASLHDVRVMVTSRGDLAEFASAGRVSEELSRLLLQNVITVAPLRERKKDIPELARHFLVKHNQRLEKNVRQISDDAITKLVSYDYHVANVRELENAVARAVILTDSEFIDSGEIFLGPPPPAWPHGLNWLKLPKPIVRFGVKYVPRMLQAVAIAIFGFILYECFFGPPADQMNLGTILVWSVWWPVLALSFFFAGRIWCAACPMGLASTTVQPLWRKKLRIPGWLKKHDMHLVMGGFFAIVWVEEVTRMRESPVATGFLLLTILAGALVFGALFPRRTWCRHVCPLGGLAGVCASSSIVELRPTFDICAAKCEGHACFKGTETVPGCPLFNHVMFVDSNQHCVLCMNCVQSCPNDSPQFNLRLPGRELWTNLNFSPESGKLVVSFLGLLLGMSLIQFLERQGDGLAAMALHQHRLLSVTVILVLTTLLPLAGLSYWGRREARRAGSQETAGLWRRIGAFVPLLTVGFICYQLAFVPGLEWFRTTLAYRPDSTSTFQVSVSLLSLFQVLFLSLGWLMTVFILWKQGHPDPDRGVRGWFRGRGVSLAGAAGYWVVLLTLILGPAWLPI